MANRKEPVPSTGSNEPAALSIGVLDLTHDGLLLCMMLLKGECSAQCPKNGSNALGIGVVFGLLCHVLSFEETLFLITYAAKCTLMLSSTSCASKAPWWYCSSVWKGTLCSKACIDRCIKKHVLASKKQKLRTLPNLSLLLELALPERTKYGW